MKTLLLAATLLGLVVNASSALGGDYGCGYRNVYESHELVDVSDPRIAFEGTVADQQLAAPAIPIAK